MTNDSTDAEAATPDLRESRLRSILKAISYRIIGTLTTGAVAFWVTGDLSAAFAIGAVEPLAKILIYYLHERAWQMLPRGSVRRWARRNRAA